MKVLAIFIQYPWLALLVAGAFALLWRYRGRRSTALAAVLWTVYAVYEYLMHARILCSGECNIRVDLLFAYPLLVLVSLWAAASCLVGSGRRPLGNST